MMTRDQADNRGEGSIRLNVTAGTGKSHRGSRSTHPMRRIGHLLTFTWCFREAALRRQSGKLSGWSFSTTNFVFAEGEDGNEGRCPKEPKRKRPKLAEKGQPL